MLLNACTHSGFVSVTAAVIQDAATLLTIDLTTESQVHVGYN